MEHYKTYYQKELATPIGPLIIEGPVSSEVIKSYEFHEDLIAFRPPEKQHKA